MDLFQAYPNSKVPLEEYDGLLKALENAQVSTIDLVTMQPLEVAQACNRSITEVTPFLALVVKDVEESLAGSFSKFDGISAAQKLISTGDPILDKLFQVPVGHLTEISGAAGTGKSHLLTQLSVTVQLPPEMGGLDKAALYLSTEASLETKRLKAICAWQNKKNRVNMCSTDRVHYFKCTSSEELEHVVRYQLPVACKRHNVGLIAIDSIAGHYRGTRTDNGVLVELSERLRSLAKDMGLAVLIANQVSDRFPRLLGVEYGRDPLLVDHQARWFTGWKQATITGKRSRPNASNVAAVSSSTPSTPAELTSSQSTVLTQTQAEPTTPDDRIEDPKQPTLGLPWANCIDQRIVLKRETMAPGEKLRRTAELVFSPFYPPASCPVSISENGLTH